MSGKRLTRGQRRRRQREPQRTATRPASEPGAQPGGVLERSSVRTLLLLALLGLALFNAGTTIGRFTGPDFVEAGLKGTATVELLTYTFCGLGGLLFVLVVLQFLRRFTEWTSE